MAVEHIDAVGFDDKDPTVGHGVTGTLKTSTRTINMSAGAEFGSTYRVIRLRADSILHPGCVVYTDGGESSFKNIAAGIFAVDDNFADVATVKVGLGSGVIDVQSVGKSDLVAPPNYKYFGSPIWMVHGGLSKDPGGFIDIKLTALDAIVTGVELKVTVHYSL